MAITKIWDIRSRLDQVVNYVVNGKKTDNPVFGESSGMESLLDYTTQGDKTKPAYVTGINCNPETAQREMVLTKKQYRKEGGIIAYHAIQSFAPGEVTPDQAHVIGVELAKTLWDNFETVVATHLDKEHLHNHYVINSVSYVDGRRYYDNKQSYRRLRQVSDDLCRANHLSVIKNPRGKGTHYAEWQAERQGKPTWRGIIAADIEVAISESVTLRQFFFRLRQKGYIIKPNAQYFTLKPPGKECFVRIDRKYPEYQLERIEDRIVNQAKIKTHKKCLVIPQTKKYCMVGSLTRAHRFGGFQGLYLHYCFKLGILPKKQKRTKLPFIYKEDLLKLNAISQETLLLCQNKIETLEALESQKMGKQEEIKVLTLRRKMLENRLRQLKDEGAVAEIKTEISVISEELGPLRKAVNHCEQIAKRSIIISTKIKQRQVVMQQNKSSDSVWRALKSPPG